MMQMLSLIILPSAILLGAIILLYSIFIIFKIKYLIPTESNRFFWEGIALLIMLFFSSYLIIAYLIFGKSITVQNSIVSVLCFMGAGFVYLILVNSLRVLKELSIVNNQLNSEIEDQKSTLQKANEKSSAVADANARMTELFIDLEEAKANIENKEIALRKQNEDMSKVNAALANANSNISTLYIELDEIKEQLMQKKQELLKKNQILSKSNVALADIFKKFVPVQFLNKIAREGIENISAGYAERTQLTVMFSDIRLFTTISEYKDPNDILVLLNTYFSHMSHEIYVNNGFIDKFIGDAIMALFESINPNLSHATQALNAAIGMQLITKTIENDLKRIISAPLRTGIGIHSGEVILGTVGLEHRMDSTVLGNTVNIASRIEQLTKELDAKIIVSKTTMDLINDVYKYNYRCLGPIKIRGIQNQLILYEFFDGDSEDIKTLKHQTKQNFDDAVKYLSESHWDQAIHEYEKSLTIFPNDVAAKFLLEKCKLYSGNSTSTKK